MRTLLLILDAIALLALLALQTASAQTAPTSAADADYERAQRARNDYRQLADYYAGISRVQERAQTLRKPKTTKHPSEPRHCVPGRAALLESAYPLPASAYWTQPHQRTPIYHQTFVHWHTYGLNPWTGLAFRIR